MIIMTTEGPYQVYAQTRTNLGRVVLATTTLELLKSVVASIELAGGSEENQYIGEFLHPAPNTWTLELDKTTFKLWLDFEVEHYVGYGKNEFTEFSVMNQGPEYGMMIAKVKEETGL